ncbi:MAG: hypothetical protein Q9174_001851 [Haloplaca sp. 1 TL-2023]
MEQVNPNNMGERAPVGMAESTLFALLSAANADPHALPQGVTADVSPTAPPPTGCTSSASGSFGIAVQSVSSGAAQVKREVSQLDDGQPQVQTMASASFNNDGQVAVGMPTMVMMAAQIGDGQVQAQTTTMAPVTVISDGQPQAPTLPTPTEAPAGPPDTSPPGQGQAGSSPGRDVTMVACQTEGTLAITLANGILTDAAGRTGYIASNFQFQFDEPPQAGAIFTSGFTFCSNGTLALGDSNVFYQCLSGDFYNLYDRNWAPQCSPVTINLLQLQSFHLEDVRQNEVGLSILDELHDQLRPKGDGEKKMPTLLLYDEQGLKLFEDISYLDEYYPTNAEIEVLQQNAMTIAKWLPEGCTVLELGSGNLRKVKILLDAIELLKKRVDYYALDLSESELHRTLAAIPTHYTHVRCRGLLGTYEDGLTWLERPEQQGRPKWILSLGSSIGNFARDDAASFLQGFANKLSGKDAMVVGLDACQDKDKVYHAYNDKFGKTHEFLLNGLRHANRLLGKETFQLSDWEVIGEYDEVAGRHQAFYSPIKDVVMDGMSIEAGTRIRVEESYKYSIAQSDELWYKAGMVKQACFGNSTNDYHLHILGRQPLGFPLESSEYAAQPVPNVEEFKALWAAWDVVTQHMIPRDALLSKPIKLRNCCVFYLGHIPNFTDIHLTRATEKPATEPHSYRAIFERGIDPDVDNPEKCHAHSEIPEEWPPVTDILEYQTKVRSRVGSLFSKGHDKVPSKVGRALWLAFEHEGVFVDFSSHSWSMPSNSNATAMHLETLLYMLVQSEDVRPPPGMEPNFRTLAEASGRDIVPNEWIKIPSVQLEVGLNDPENDAGPTRYFGWDNEKPARTSQVGAFEAKARALTNEDFARYLCTTGQDTIPAAWAQSNEEPGSQRVLNSVAQGRDGSYMNGESEPVPYSFLVGKSIRTVYGLVRLEHALSWPVYASYNELAACAKWMNGRIPTADEVRSIYDYADICKAKEAEEVQAKKISAVNGYAALLACDCSCGTDV